MSFNGSIIFLGASDLERTDNFYREILGFELYKDQGLCRIYQVPGGGMIGFCTHQEVFSRGESPIITFLTSDVDGWYKKLIQEGFKMKNKPKTNPRFNIYHFFLSDPDGYTVEIQRFL
ncbi:MAG: VOC family protein [Bacillota bacterium]